MFGFKLVKEVDLEAKEKEIARLRSEVWKGEEEYSKLAFDYTILEKRFKQMIEASNYNYNEKFKIQNQLELAIDRIVAFEAEQKAQKASGVGGAGV